jgi:glycosyltransferase involved in cell wall biosynthesis
MLWDLTFVLPAGSEAISGGNICNDHLIRSLRRTVPAKTLDVEEGKRAILDGQPGLYFIDTLNLPDFLAFPPRKPGQRFALVVHHLPSLEPGLPPDDEALRIEKTALPLFDAFLTTSPFTTQLLIGRGFAPEKILTVIPALPPIEADQRVYEPPLRATLVGNLIPRKCVLPFLRALDPLVHEDDRWSIDIIGRTDIDPDYARQCDELVRSSARLGRRVRIHGPIPYNRVHEFYRRAYVFVSAAEMETFGMALQEARGHGLPILALDGGYARHHFTHAENGLLFHSIEPLARGFLDLARDDRMMHELFDRAQRLRSTGGHTWEAAAQDFLRQLERCLSRL